MSDLIRREELLEQIAKDSNGHEGQYGDEWLFVDTINSIPTVEPKAGHWEHIDIKGYPYVVCSECGQVEGWDDNTGMYCALIGEKYAHFCPCCGAKMERSE